MIILETAIALILVLGILVLIHELGHYTAARLCGIRVEEFAFGFGPKLISLFKRGDTEYTIHPFPLGGFVKLAGMEPGEEDIPDGFQAQSILKRAVVIFAGPLASLLLAVWVFVAIGVFWGFPDEARQLNRVAMVSPQTIAQKIDLRAGDRILKIDGHRITEGNQMINLIHSKPGQKITLMIDRDGQKITKTAAPAWAIDYLGTAWTFMDPHMGVAQEVPDNSLAAKAGVKKDDILVSIDGRSIDSGEAMVKAVDAADGRPVNIMLHRGKSTVPITVSAKVSIVKFMGAEWQWESDGAYALGQYGPLIKEGSEAYKTGIRSFDKLVSINGVEIKSGNQMRDYLKEQSGQPIKLAVKRDQKIVTLDLKPTPAQFAAVDARYYDANGQFGFLPQSALVKMGFGDSIKTGLNRSWRYVILLVTSLAPNKIGDSVGGPVMIAKQTSSMVALGPYYVVQMMGLLSLSLGFINLVPIPVVDGGHLAILGVEAIRRKRLTPEQMQVVQFVGLMIIAVLFVAIFWSDIFKLRHGLVPQ